MMRYKDNPDMAPVEPKEILDQLHKLSVELRGLIKEDGGPAKVKLSDGSYATGEIAEKWLEFQRGISRTLDSAIYHLERSFNV